MPLAKLLTSTVVSAMRVGIATVICKGVRAALAIAAQRDAHCPAGILQGAF
jgi:hypothetical protein